jgi:trk system potassium uptake protein
LKQRQLLLQLDYRTPELSPVGKILIIFTMFAGSVGPLTISYAVALHRKPDPFNFPKGRIMIG